MLKPTWTDGISGTAAIGITVHLQVLKGWKSITYLNLHKEDSTPVTLAKYCKIVKWQRQGNTEYFTGSCQLDFFQFFS